MIGALDVRGAFYSLLVNPGVAPVSPRRTLEVAAEVESPKQTTQRRSIAIVCGTDEAELTDPPLDRHLVK